MKNIYNIVTIVVHDVYFRKKCFKFVNVNNKFGRKKPMIGHNYKKLSCL
jgi:hypothetical protein